MRKEKPLDKDSMLKAFKCIDTNGDGFITHDELFRLLTKVQMFSCFLRYINPFHSQYWSEGNFSLQDQYVITKKGKGNYHEIRLKPFNSHEWPR